MIEIRKTEMFAKYIDDLRDIHARARVLARIQRLAYGNAGNVKAVGEEYRNCVLTMGLDIGSNTNGKGIS